jgi:hypothetical protein
VFVYSLVDIVLEMVVKSGDEENVSESEPFSHLLDLTSDPSKINDVFPLVQQNKRKPF